MSARVASVLSMGTTAGSTVLAISGHTSMVRLLRRNTRVRPTTKPGGSSLAPARISVTVRGRGSGGGARVMLALRHAPRQRHGQRVPDRGVLRRQLLELGASQPQHQAVAQRGHGGGAHAAGEEGDLADRLAGTQLGDRLAPTGDGDEEAPGDDHVEGVRHLALAHQHVAALEVERLELGGEARALGILEIAEDLDPVEAVLGNLRFHLGSCIRAFPESTLSQLALAENASPSDWVERAVLSRGADTRGAEARAPSRVDLDWAGSLPSPAALQVLSACEIPSSSN